MAYIGEPYTVYYKARDYRESLVDVRMVVFKPNKVKLGVYTLSELNNGDGRGIYYYDFNDADIEGVYLFVVNCPSWPKKDARQVYFAEKPWNANEKRQIRDALGIDGEKVSSSGGKVQEILDNVITVSGDVTFLKDIEGGKWELTAPNNLKFYKSDNVTLVASFLCYNSAGLPAIDNITKVERV